jgi:hypothetical protein
MARYGVPSPERRAEFVQMLKAGNFTATACKWIGVAESSYYRWKAQAAQGSASPIVATWMRQCEEAEAFAEAASVQLLQRAATNGDVRASMFMLSKRFSARWGDRTQIAVEVESRSSVANPRDRLNEVLTELGEELRREVAWEPIEATTSGEVLPMRRSETG